MDEEGNEYKIIVSTSGRFAAGTDARVFIVLIGVNESSEEIELKDNTSGKQLFEAGSTDEFNITINNEIGFISKINLRHDGSGIFPGWHPNKVEVFDKRNNQKYRFHCNRWLATDEGDGRISVEFENKVMPIVKVDQLDEKNRPLHNTIKFITTHFVVRRGQSIFLDIHLARPMNRKSDSFYITLKTGKNPKEFDKSFVTIQRANELDSFDEIWAYKILGVEDKVIHVEVNCPSDALVAKYEMSIEDDDGVIYTHNNPLFILFNPWNKVDDVYMKEDESRKEYVLRQHGIVYIGTSKYQYPRRWYFGQFEEVSLNCAFQLLDATKPLGRESPTEVARRFSSLVNSCDNNGLLVGNWSGNYEGGKAPTYWTSSPPIFEEYMSTQNSVKYGQCWVFSAILTTVLRCIGIPCRSVTNFNSAHDTNGNISKDVYLDEECNVMEGLSLDSIWNFHCWNDAWMARPDLKPGYGGWQAIDATPQETSYGLYQCGPCSLRAIKEGDIDYPYDGKFILAEVNSDMFYHKKDADGEWQVFEINRCHVGKKISTKAVGMDRREDITKCYKFAEKSAVERASVRKAMGKAGNVAVTSTPKTVEMKVKPSENAIEIGEDLKVNIYLKNTSEKGHSLLISVQGNVIRYNGVSKGDFHSTKFKEEISGNEEKTVSITIKGENYMKHLNEYTAVRLLIACTVKETLQVCTSVKVVEIKRPDLKFINAPEVMKLGSEETIEIMVNNPLEVALTDCKLHIDGTLMKERISLPHGDIPAKSSAKILVHLSPNTRTGRKSLLATFNSPQLACINSSVKKFKVIQ